MLQGLCADCSSAPSEACITVYLSPPFCSPVISQEGEVISIELKFPSHLQNNKTKDRSHSSYSILHCCWCSTTLRQRSHHPDLRGERLSLCPHCPVSRSLYVYVSPAALNNHFPSVGHIDAIRSICRAAGPEVMKTSSEREGLPFRSHILGIRFSIWNSQRRGGG